MTTVTLTPIATRLVNQSATTSTPTCVFKKIAQDISPNPWHQLDVSWDHACYRENYKIPQTYPNPEVSAVPHLPNPEKWSASAALALTQILIGQRPATQIERWVEPQLYSALERRVQLNQRIAGIPKAERIPKIATTRICVVNPRVVESVHTVCGDFGSYAVCVRLEARWSQWMITAIEIA